MGFRKYDITVGAILDEMTTQQKIAVVAGFENDVSPGALMLDINVPKGKIKKLYKTIKNIEKFVVKVLYGRLIEIPASEDVDGNITEATYYNITTKPALKALREQANTGLTAAEFGYVIDRMLINTTDGGTVASLKAALNGNQ